jgi:hypothetical protein
MRAERATELADIRKSIARLQGRPEIVLTLLAGGEAKGRHGHQSPTVLTLEGRQCDWCLINAGTHSRGSAPERSTLAWKRREIAALRHELDTVKRQFDRLRQIDVAVKVERDLTAPLH